jgi:iron complex outermembrane receptor protein
VINATSQTGSQPPTIEASSYYGSFGTWHYGMKATGAVGDGSHAGDVDCGFQPASLASATIARA